MKSERKTTTFWGDLESWLVVGYKWENEFPNPFNQIYINTLRQAAAPQKANSKGKLATVEQTFFYSTRVYF